MSRQSLDDIDGLFGRLEAIEPPAELELRVLARTVAAPAAGHLRRELAWGLLDLVALVALLALSISLGWALVDSGSIYALRAVLENAELLADGWTDLLPAILDALPWLQLAGVILNVALVCVLSRMLLGEVFRVNGRRHGESEGR